MLRIMRAGAGGFAPAPDDASGWSLPPEIVWIDLLEPTREEERVIERELSFELPTREDMEEIETSSRLYQDDGATVMTAIVLCNSEGDAPSTAPVTFALIGERLVTIRYAEPKSFKTFASHAERQPSLCPNGPDTFLSLMEAIVDRTADILERNAEEVETISATVFGAVRPRSYEDILTRLGRAQSLNAKARDSLSSLARVVGFATLARQLERSPEARARLKTLSRDIQSVAEHANAQAGGAGFMLDATLGLINIQQNAIIKIFSVAAVAFLPPTLIASVYGMNFEHMPELDWRLGYPMAVAGMVLSAVLPLMWFRKKGWL